MNVLAIGAGALGQCYAGHLALGGNPVTFLVRRPRPPSQINLHAMGSRRASRTPLVRYVVDAADAADTAHFGRPDVALLCVRSDPLDLALIDRLAQCLPPHTTFVSFTPGFADADQIAARLGANRSLFVMPAAWATARSDALQYWFPPGAASRVGPHPRAPDDLAPLRARADAIIAAFGEVGVRFAWDRHSVTRNHVTTAALAPFGALLRVHPDDLPGALRDRALVAEFCAAVHEAATLAAVVWGSDVAPAVPLAIVRPAIIRAIGWYAVRARPDLVAFLGSHLTKIRLQNDLMLKFLLDESTRRNVAMPTFRRLVERGGGLEQPSQAPTSSEHAT